MRRPALRLLPVCLAMACAARAQEIPAPTWELCPAPDGLPLFQPLPEASGKAPREGVATDVSAENLDVSKEKVTVLTGKVELSRGDQWLATEQMTYRHEDETFVTGGGVKYQDRGLRFVAEKAEGDQKADVIRLEKVRYQFNQNLGNGIADAITMRGDQGRLDGATYSTCPPGQRQWEFSASRIDIDQEDAMGSARNATLRLGGVPVLWLPYIRFPTDDRRRTGLLSPKIGYEDRNGFEYEQPVYLNLAPNYDATLTPHWLSERGLMMGGEFRYLTRRHRGGIAGTWLPDDDLTGTDRGFASLAHRSALGPNWYASASINHVSDVNYFTDFGNSLAATSISTVSSRAGLFGRGLGWTASLWAQDWQIANPVLTPRNEPFRRLPTLDATWSRPFADWLELGIRGEAVRFQHEVLAGGERLDIQPQLTMSFGGAAWYLTPELAWRYTAYSLEDRLLPPGGDNSPTRSLPIMSLDAGAFFERDVDWRGSGYLQTLEPRIFYLKVPYRDQSRLPIFDTQPLTFGWPGLFRDNRFGGADRQADADQVTLALTSRVLGAEDGREIFNVGIGRIHYFEPPRVTGPGAPPLSDAGSAWVAEASLALARSWNLSVAQQWDPDTERTVLSAVRSQWRFGDGGLVNLSYRYRASLLEQTDLSFVVPLNLRWRLMGRWNYSLRDGETLEALGGVEWKSCCVAVRVLGRRYLREFGGESNTGIYLELELNGVGSLGRDTARLLDDAILDYSR